MFGTRSVDFEPFVNAALVIYTQAGKSCNGVTLTQLVQADNTLLLVLNQNVLIVRDSWFGKAHYQMTFDIVCRYHLVAQGTSDITKSKNV